MKFSTLLILAGIGYLIYKNFENVPAGFPELTGEFVTIPLPRIDVEQENEWLTNMVDEFGNMISFPTYGV